MDKTLDDFHTELRNEILAEAESSNELTEDTFFDFFSEDLIKAEVIQTADRCFYDKPGLKSQKRELDKLSYFYALLFILVCIESNKFDGC